MPALAQDVGQVLMRVSPSATLRTCAPRQMPSTGSFQVQRRAGAVRTPTRPGRARAGRSGRMRLLPVSRRVDVFAAGDHRRPSSPSSTRSASQALTGCGGSSTAMPPASVTPWK